MGSLAQAVMLGYVFGREKNEALAPWTARRAETRPNAAAMSDYFDVRKSDAGRESSRASFIDRAMVSTRTNVLSHAVGEEIVPHAKGRRRRGSSADQPTGATHHASILSPVATRRRLLECLNVLITEVGRTFGEYFRLGSSNLKVSVVSFQAGGCVASSSRRALWLNVVCTAISRRPWRRVVTPA